MAAAVLFLRQRCESGIETKSKAGTQHTDGKEARTRKERWANFMGAERVESRNERPNTLGEILSTSTARYLCSPRTKLEAGSSLDSLEYIARSLSFPTQETHREREEERWEGESDKWFGPGNAVAFISCFSRALRGFFGSVFCTARHACNKRFATMFAYKELSASSSPSLSSSPR